MASAETYRIGELAARSGLTPDALRYYERLGLLPHPPRTAGGFRVYPTGTLARLRVITQAQAQGLTLNEIRVLVSYLDKGGRERCRPVRDLVAAKLCNLDMKLRELREFRRSLQGYLEDCERALGEPADVGCPVTKELGRKE